MHALTRKQFLRSAAFGSAVALAAPGLLAQPAMARSAEAADTRVRYKTIDIDGVEIFYREAGAPEAPAILLLHGFPTSSQMFRGLIPLLAKHYRLIAPDFPGFGRSAMPDRGSFEYSFANYARLMAGLTDALGMQRYALYIMDYGAPVGLRLAIARPERVTALVVQNGNAYTEGLREFWDPIRAYWQSNAAGDREALRNFLKIDATEWQYTHGVPDPSLISPDAWQLDQVYLDRPGNQEIQLDLFYDYRTNVDLYPDFQAFFREHQPPTLIVWGKNDYIFPAEGATPYVCDLPNAELHLIDAGHFILESNGPEVGALIDDFLGRTIGRK